MQPAVDTRLAKIDVYLTGRAWARTLPIARWERRNCEVREKTGVVRRRAAAR